MRKRHKKITEKVGKWRSTKKVLRKGLNEQTVNCIGTRRNK